jgi:TolA-binding protein
MSFRIIIAGFALGGTLSGCDKIEAFLKSQANLEERVTSLEQRLDQLNENLRELKQD